MRISRFYILLIVGLLMFAGRLAAQQVHISLVDKIDKKPIAFAHVLIEDIGAKSGISKGYTSDINGKITFSISAPVKLTASFVGYKLATDTVHPGEKLTIRMKPMVYNVDEVVVTAQYRPETVDRSVYRIKVLSSQVINAKAAVNLNEMLAGELNIRTTHDNSLGSSISMQGLGGEHIKFLVDGVPVIGRQNGNLDLQQMNLQNIDHIEIIEGPMSVVYGSNALAGVINIIKKDSDKQKVSVTGDAYYESVGNYNFSLGGSYAWKRHSLSIYGGRNFFDGYSPVDTTRYMQWKPKLQYDFDGSYMYRSKKTKLKVSGNYFNEEIQDKGNPLEVFNWDKAFDKYYYTQRWVTRAELNQKVLNRAMVNVLSAYSSYRRVKNTYLTDLTNLNDILVPGVEQQDTVKFDNILFRADFNNYLNSEILKYQLGIDFNRESGSGKKIDDGYQEIGDYAAFLSLNITPIPQFSIQPGLRVIYNTNYSAPLVYSINLKWTITEPLAARLSMARGFRAPSLKELYLDFVDINHNIQGNPNLEAETSYNFNLAINYNPQTPATYNWGIDVGLFYNHISNNIKLVRINAEPLLYSYINVDEFYTHGFDLKFNNRIYPWLRLNLGLGLTGRKSEISGIEDNPGYVYSPGVSIQADYWWQLTDLNFALFYKYNGDYPELIFTLNEPTVIGTIDSYNSLDINVSRWFWKRRINVQVGAKNLFDVTNVGTQGMPDGGGGAHSGGGGSQPVDWGRTYFIKLQFVFNQ